MAVGARGVVHTPQFNGKQEGGVDQRDNTSPALPPQRSSGRALQLRFCHKATEHLEQVLGKATEVVSASPDTGQQGGGASKKRVANSLKHCRGWR